MSLLANFSGAVALGIGISLTATLLMADYVSDTCSNQTLEPFTTEYIKHGEPLNVRFCRALGYEPKIVRPTFNATGSPYKAIDFIYLGSP